MPLGHFPTRRLQPEIAVAVAAYSLNNEEYKEPKSTQTKKRDRKLDKNRNSCMHACMHEATNAAIKAWMHESMTARIHACNKQWVHEQGNVWKNGYLEKRSPFMGERRGGGSTAIGWSGWSGGKAGSEERCFPPLAVLSYIPNSDIPTAKLTDWLTTSRFSDFVS